MEKLFLIMGISLFFAFLADKRNDGFSQRQGGASTKKDVLCVLLMLLGMILFTGLRTRYNDTTNYIESYIYRQQPLKEYLEEGDTSIGGNPGFHIVLAIFKQNGAMPQSFILFFSAATLTIFVWFFRKYSPRLLLTVFLFFVIGGFTNSMAAMKQCFAMAIGMIAIDRYIHKQYVLYTLFVVIAMTFHPYALLYFFVPVLDTRPWSGRMYLVLSIAFLCSIFMEDILGLVTSVTSAMGEDYTAESFTGAGVNIFRVIVCWAPVILSFVYRKQLFTNTTRAENVFANVTTLGAMIMFMALFGTANYFGRLALYFHFYQVIFTPWMIKRLSKKDQVLIVPIMVIAYLAYFWYENSYGYSFEAHYSRRSFFDYLLS